MYSSEDFERLFIRYKGEAYPKGESIQTFCHRNNVPYNLFEKWYKDTRHKIMEVDVSGRPSPTETDKPKEEGFLCCWCSEIMIRIKTYTHFIFIYLKFLSLPFRNP